MSSLVERHILPVGREYLDSFPVVVIEGARLVGLPAAALWKLGGGAPEPEFRPQRLVGC